VHATRLLLCLCALLSSILLWVRLNHTIDWSFYVVFSPLFAFEIFVLASAVAAFTVYFLRGSSGWTFYWVRQRGTIRWLIIHTSPWETAIAILLGANVMPLLACALEGHGLLPKPLPRFSLPFFAFWLTALWFICSLIRRRSFSAACFGSFTLLWLPLVSLSVLLFLRLSIIPHLPVRIVLVPSLTVTVLVLLFVGFLALASFWIGPRGDRDWAEYAMLTMLTLLWLLLPLLLFQLALWAYFADRVSANVVFIPWVLWLSGLLVNAVWRTIAPFPAPPAVPPIDDLTRPWAQQRPDRDRNTHTDMEMLLPINGIV